MLERLPLSPVRPWAARYNGAPTLVTSCTSLPPGGALAPWDGPAALMPRSPTCRSPQARPHAAPGRTRC
ncbi:MAG: hypothetical protein EOO54_07610 [Haliea sp.]|nr:MAG: hypothetical protein EOO54_07610 [Haliea sp.]